MFSGPQLRGIIAYFHAISLDKIGKTRYIVEKSTTEAVYDRCTDLSVSRE